MPIRFDLLRHAQARPADSAGDPARPLTPAGAAAMRELGRRLREGDWRPQRALISTYLRTQQTAQLVLEAAELNLEPEIVDELLADGGPEQAALTLETMLDDTAHALLVGHQPLLGMLVEWWAGVSQPLSPGEFVAIEFAATPGHHAGRVIQRIAPP